MDGNIDDVGFISLLIDELIIEYGIDPNRVYITGISNGGFMSYTLACELYTWAMKAGYKNNVLTIYERHSSEEHEDTSFHGSDPVLIRRACEILEKSDKCIIFSGETADECGIKFL